MKKAVTLKDIAQKTGFSINTVSHALNDKPDISDATKKIIREAADELGYIANAAASALRSGVSQLIALIIPDISNLHFAELSKEIEGIFHEQDYTLMILNTDEDADREKKALRTAISKGVDGIIFCPTQQDNENIRFLRDSGVPFVLLGRFFFEDRDSYVVADDIKGGYLAARHLIRLGHRDILFLNLPDCVSNAQDRLLGAKQAFAECGLSETLLQNIELPLDSLKREAEVENQLRQNSHCTGIIAFNDMIALAAIHYLERMSKSVPADYSVVGFDNIQAGYVLPGGLTTVCPCIGNMAVHLVNAILEQRENHKELLRIKMDTHLVVRNSTRSIE